jgi:hypothetical protein
LPIYFFHVRDGVDILLDNEGRELASERAIATAALKDVRALISADALTGRINLDQHLDVEDSSGRVVHCLNFEDAIDIGRGANKGLSVN